MSEVNRSPVRESVFPTTLPSRPALLEARFHHIVASAWPKPDEAKQSGPCARDWSLVHSKTHGEVSMCGYLLTWNLEGLLTLREAGRRIFLSEVLAHREGIDGVIPIDGRGQAVVWSGTSMTLWSIPSMERLVDWTFPYAVRGAQIALPHLLTWGDRGTHLIHLNRTDQCRLLQQSGLSRPSAMALSDRYVAGWGADNPTVYVWSVESGDLVQSYRSSDKEGSPLCAHILENEKIEVRFSHGEVETWSIEESGSEPAHDNSDPSNDSGLGQSRLSGGSAHRLRHPPFGRPY